MSFLSRLVWKSLPKQQRKLFLSLLNEPNRQIANTIVAGSPELPKTFEEHKFIFIHIPKVAGISLINALGFEGEHKWHMPLKYYQYTFPEQYDNYFKFAFVRNPWDRAFSAYHFLLQGGISEKDSAQVELVKSYPTFEDFVLNWLSVDSCQSLIHFTPMYSFVENSYGTISLDFIGRYENIQHDYDYVRDKLGYGSPLPWKNTSQKINFREVYSPKMIDKVALVYERDIAEFGYDF